MTIILLFVSIFYLMVEANKSKSLYFKMSTLAVIFVMISDVCERIAIRSGVETPNSDVIITFGIMAIVTGTFIPILHLARRYLDLCAERRLWRIKNAMKSSSTAKPK